MHDFYSDTQTRPTRAMREAALDAPLGDERHDADPPTLELCARVAGMLGMEAALFLPSGTMCNEIAIAVHTRPGDEVICTRESHIIFAESGGPAALSGVMMHPIDGERGMLTPEQLQAAIRPRSAHAPRSRLLVAEQTANLAGGAIWPLDQLTAVAQAARDAGLATHLDGARLLNAQVATGIPAAAYARGFDSAWIAFTKGLGCPVGAVLAGSRDFVAEAWLLKRRWGGAMRQTGVLTAMCLYALDHHVARLAEDHALARTIGARLAGLPAIARVLPVETNIVIADLAERAPDAREAARQLRQGDVTVTVVGPRRLRMVTHLDVGPADADALVAAIGALG
ncbi:beta-eliminating lyase-related protein [Rhodovulum tesquicola]|uniref:threonine aldolase family protein n=1 Tax=Rhodovulum tesquicola TaxID=540254 RepID=UPI0020986595|nr:GntG family PLP-dependent aldolase [Rhodovulum tesquicola]MCO8146345.1 beta-eliminating lyase-related protein [Rhodovulum tesquicola]